MHSSLSFPFWLLVAVICSAGTCSDAIAQPRTDRIEEIVGAQYESGRFNGALLVADGEEVIYRGAFGYSDQESGAANSPDMPFPIRSITKSFTAILILQLAEEGAVNLDGTLAEHLPSFSSDTAERITLHHLLTHTSGLPDYILEIPGYMEYEPPSITADSAMAFVADVPLEFEPGEGYAYSNTGYVLLAMIIERATGTAYGEVLEERIFQPLGMENTRWTPTEAAPGLPRQYLPGAEREAPVIRYFPGAAGIISTLDDMHIFASALGSPELLSPEMWERAFTPHADPANVARPHPATRFPYGYGFALAEAPIDTGRSARVAMHVGLGYGGSATLQRLIDGDAVVVSWNNVAGLPPFIPGILPVAASGNP